MEQQQRSQEAAGASGLTKQAPTFGVLEPGQVYRDRRAAYAVVFGPRDTVATVAGASGHFWLPGGGSSPGESAEATLHRELLEELGRGVCLLRRLGEAVQFFHAREEDTHYRMVGVFFWGEFTDAGAGPAEHDLVWLPLAERAAFFHECHRWAVNQAIPLWERIDLE